MKIAIFVIVLLCLPSLVMSATEMSLKTHDEVLLDARYYAANKPGPGLLFLNMCDPSRDQLAWQNVATSLAEHGYHVMTLDYRGFGKSGGERPTHLTSVEVAMPYWREHWMDDVRLAYDTLVSQPGVQEQRMGIAGASCGVFMGLEFALANSNIKSLAMLGGPTEQQQNNQLAEHDELPVLIMSGNEGPVFGWSDKQFAATKHPDSRMHKFKFVTHGTNIFEYERSTETLVVDWFLKTVPIQ
jgi:dienelactone hydrolase